MRAFLWIEEKLLDSFQDVSSALIIAEDLADAQAQWSERRKNRGELAEQLPAPTRQWQVDAYSKPDLFIFPSGYCS